MRNMIQPMEFSKIKLIVTDMDGTLLNSKGDLDPRFFELVRELRSHRVRMAVASGGSKGGTGVYCGERGHSDGRGEAAAYSANEKGTCHGDRPLPEDDRREIYHHMLKENCLY